jgi:hypothetical protein
MVVPWNEDGNRADCGDLCRRCHQVKACMVDRLQDADRPQANTPLLMVSQEKILETKQESNKAS